MEKTDKESGGSAAQSPRFFRRKLASQVSSEPANVAQKKVVLGEVEEKLKSMRQKRLNRLSTFVTDQTKLANERAARDTDGNEMENAIMSMKQSTKEERNTSFKSIDEKIMIQEAEKFTSEEMILKEKVNEPRTPKLFRKASNESMDKSKQLQKSSTTMKFISKFNCATMQSAGISIEDLTNENEYKKSSDREGSRPNLSRNRTQSASSNSLQEDVSNANDNKEIIVENENYSPLLTPVGKQRRGIYLYDNECKFLENEKPPTLSTFKQIEKNDTEKGKASKYIEPPATPKSKIGNQVSFFSSQFSQDEKQNKSGKPFSYRNPNAHLNSNKNIVLETKVENTYENKPVIRNREDKPKPLMKTFKRNSLSDILDNSNKINNLNRISANDSVTSDKKTNDVTYQNNLKISQSKLTYENIVLKSKESQIVTNVVNNSKPQNKSESNKNILNSLKSPMPLPRHISDEEKTLKKFQRNLDSINDILQNDSDVDADEIEDLKKALDDTNALLVDYGRKLNLVQGKSSRRDDCLQKLDSIKEELQKTDKEISNFRGLKRDSTYGELSNRLSNYLSEVNKIHAGGADILRKKKVLLEAESCLNNLELKVLKNENMLLQVLESQVDSISTNIFNITKV